MSVLQRAIQGNKVPGFISGLTLANNATDATNDIDIAVGSAADANGYIMNLASVLTKQLDVNWVVGSGQGGLDTGSIANGTYAVWLIQRSDTGVVDVLFSASMTAPTMPANYDRKRRIGNILRVSNTIVAFIQNGDRFLWKSGSYLDVNATNPGTSAVTRALTIPAATGVSLTAIVNLQLQVNTGAASGSSAYISSLSIDDQAPSFTAAPLSQVVSNIAAGNVFSSAPVEIATNPSGQIRTRLSSSDANTFLRIATLGWIDTRGRLN